MKIESAVLNMNWGENGEDDLGFTFWKILLKFSFLVFLSPYQKQINQFPKKKIKKNKLLNTTAENSKKLQNFLQIPKITGRFLKTLAKSVAACEKFPSTTCKNIY
jgi:hypothetical protein